MKRATNQVEVVFFSNESILVFRPYPPLPLCVGVKAQRRVRSCGGALRLSSHASRPAVSLNMLHGFLKTEYLSDLRYKPDKRRKIPIVLETIPVIEGERSEPEGGRKDTDFSPAETPGALRYAHGAESSMTANIAYALNPAKGTARLFQTAVNLDSPETAWREMKNTKERWGKTDGIMGFHVVQSFRPGEISPELAHKVGAEFVERCFPVFEAVIGTHLDKHHIHNHIVLNSVSYLDGHKYHSTRESYYRELRKVSDELCKKYGLSVVEPHEEGPKGKSHAEWQAEKSGQPTWCSAIREDVDYAVARSLTFEQFVKRLRDMGYEVKTEVKHMAVRSYSGLQSKPEGERFEKSPDETRGAPNGVTRGVPGKERFTRLRRLDDDYTEEALRRRILENDPLSTPEDESPLGQMAQAGRSSLPVKRGHYHGSLRNPTRKKAKGLRALYLWYAFRMGNIRKSGSSSRKTHYLLREDIHKLQKRDRMATLLVKNCIETYDQLHAHRDDCQGMIAFLCDRRAELKKLPPSEAVAAELNGIREKLKTLRREVRLCGDIETDSVALQKKRDELKALEAHEPEKPHRAIPIKDFYHRR